VWVDDSLRPDDGDGLRGEGGDFGGVDGRGGEDLDRLVVAAADFGDEDVVSVLGAIDGDAEAT